MQLCLFFKTTVLTSISLKSGAFQMRSAIVRQKPPEGRCTPRDFNDSVFKGEACFRYLLR